MQLVLPLPGDVDDVAAVEAAARHRVLITALSPMHLTPAAERGLLLGFGRLPEHRIPGATRALAAALNEVGLAGSAG
jgi:DNA-binding transcriptional MocR family regulator